MTSQMTDCQIFCFLRCCDSMWLHVSIRLPPLALLVLANLYSHTSVCLDSRLICHSQMSSSEAAMPLIWLPHPQGR